MQLVSGMSGSELKKSRDYVRARLEGIANATNDTNIMSLRAAYVFGDAVDRYKRIKGMSDREVLEYLGYPGCHTKKLQFARIVNEANAPTFPWKAGPYCTWNMMRDKMTHLKLALMKRIGDFK
jgi:hypothetical protein